MLAARIVPVAMAGLGLLLGLAVSQPASAQNRPFPRHTAYTQGTILPNHEPRAALDDVVQQFYDSWKATFIRQGCGAGRYYVTMDGRVATMPANETLAVSEGIGLGMLIVPYMAGHDPDARAIFDGLYLFSRDHPSQHDPDLMAWRQMGDCASSDDPNAATDGDLNIAFGLLLAHAQWGSGGAINYRAAALQIMAAIRARLIHPTSQIIQMGDWVHPDYPLEYEAARTSDIMPMQLRSFYRATNDQVWWDILTANLNLLARMQTAWAPGTGLVPDFAVDTTNQGRPADPGFVGESRAGQFSFNACRVPWQVAIEYLLNGATKAKMISDRMLGWLHGSIGTDIYQIYGGYQLNGTPTVGWNYVCFTGAFGVGAMLNPAHQGLLNRIWDDVAHTSVSDQGDYYGGTMRMVYLLAMSGNLWRP